MKKSFKKFLAVFMLAGLFAGGALNGSVFAKTPKLMIRIKSLM